MSETLTNGVIVPDKGSRDWYADLRSNWLKLDSLMAGGNITVNPAQTEGILVATITVGGKEYKLYQQDGDVSVKIDPSAENAEYPLVASTSAEANTGPVVMAPAVTVNPSTGAVTATSFKGKLDGNASTATNATKAVQDGAGAVITDTYATKKELGSKANDSDVVHKSGAETIVGTKTFSSWQIFSDGLNVKQIFSNGLNVKWITGNNELKALHLFGSMDDKYQGFGSELKLYGDDANYGKFILVAQDKTKTNVKIFLGLPDGTLTWDGKTVLTAGNGMTVDTDQTITGAKIFRKILSVEGLTGKNTGSNLGIYSGDLNASHCMYNNRVDGTITISCVNATTKKSSTMDLKPDGTFTWNGGNVLTDANKIMLAKNLSGTSIKPGGVVDCGNGNGNLKQWYLGADGTFLLANTLPTGAWKSTSFVTLAPNEGGIFIKLS